MSDADRLLEGKITMSQRVISQKTYHALMHAALDKVSQGTGALLDSGIIGLLLEW